MSTKTTKRGLTVSNSKVLNSLSTGLVTSMRLQNFALVVVFLMIHFRKVFFSLSDIIIVLLGLLQAEAYEWLHV